MNWILSLQIFTQLFYIPKSKTETFSEKFWWGRGMLGNTLYIVQNAQDPADVNYQQQVLFGFRQAFLDVIVLELC